MSGYNKIKKEQKSSIKSDAPNQHILPMPFFGMGMLQAIGNKAAQQLFETNKIQRQVSKSKLQNNTAITKTAHDSVIAGLGKDADFLIGHTKKKGNMNNYFTGKNNQT